MKKLLIIASLLLVLPAITNASTFVATPSSGSYTNGDNITLRISVDPAGSTIYTAMLDAKFIPTSFEVVSFTMNDSVLAMKQTGYDSVNNTNGTLIKTGGYAGGISSITPFGTLILRAKGSGTGTFTVNSTSKLLDVNNSNKQTGSQIASFTITTKVPVPVITPIVEVKKVVKTVAPVEPEQVVVETAPIIETKVATSTQVATVVEAKASTNKSWIFIILGMLVSFVTGYIVGSKKLFGF